MCNMLPISTLSKITSSEKILLYAYMIIALSCTTAPRSGQSASKVNAPAESALTSTSTSWRTDGAEVWPCLVRPQPATVAVRPESFKFLAGRQTGTMCCLKATVRDNFTKATSFRKSVGEYCGCTCCRHQFYHNSFIRHNYLPHANTL